MIRDQIINEYFDWLTNIVCENRFAKEISYRKLLSYLHNTEFTWRLKADSSRAEDGISLRWRFACETNREHLYDEISECLDGPCSILEMMIALSIRCEETIMDDPRFGNRTGQWFWDMIVSLGLGSMMDDEFDKKYTDKVIKRFLRRKYEPNGEGGLFTIKKCNRDLRTVGIWCQLCWYLDIIA